MNSNNFFSQHQRLLPSCIYVHTRCRLSNSKFSNRWSYRWHRTPSIHWYTMHNLPLIVCQAWFNNSIRNRVADVNVTINTSAPPLVREVMIVFYGGQCYGIRSTRNQHDVLWFLLAIVGGIKRNSGFQWQLSMSTSLLIVDAWTR